MRVRSSEATMYTTRYNMFPWLHFLPGPINYLNSAEIKPGASTHTNILDCCYYHAQIVHAIFRRCVGIVIGLMTIFLRVRRTSMATWPIKTSILGFPWKYFKMFRPEGHYVTQHFYRHHYMSREIEFWSIII